MKLKIKSVYILLCLCITISLSACGNSESTSTSSKTDTGDLDKLGATGTKSYSSTEIELPGNPDSINATYIKDDMVYLHCSSRGENFDILENWFIKINADGSDAVEFGRTEADGSFTLDMKVDSDGQIWLMSSNESLQISTTASITLDKISPDGNIIDSCSLNFVSEYFQSVDSQDTVYPVRMEFSNGHLYFLCEGMDDSRILVLEYDGNMPSADDIVLYLNSSEKFTDYMVGLMQADDGKIYAYNSTRFAEIGENDWGDTIDIDTKYSDIYASQNGIYFSDGSNLYGYDMQTGQQSKLLNWIATGISYATHVIPLGNNSFLCICYENSGTVCRILTENEASSKEIQTLTVATINNYFLTEAALAFNNAHDDIKIEVLDYSLSSNSEDFDAYFSDILTKLNTDIISGDIPDIFDFGSLYTVPVSQYAIQGVLTDINSLIENDSSISRSDFFENVLDAYEIDGKLYEMPIEFSIRSLDTKKDTVGGKQTISLEEFKDILQDSGASNPFGDTSRALLFEGFIDCYSDMFIDWTTGECSFDSDEFVSLLEAFNYLPKGQDIIVQDENYEEWNTYEAISDGGQLFDASSVSGIGSIMVLRGIYGENGYALIGYPGLEEPATVISSYSSFGISEACENKETAWEFLKSMTYENTDTYSMGLPITRSGFDLMVEDYKKEVEESGELSHTWWLGQDVDIPYQVESDAEIIKNLIEKQNTAARYNPALNEIISEEIQAFFSGDKSAEETAKLIQSRASTYVNELR